MVTILRPLVLKEHCHLDRTTDELVSIRTYTILYLPRVIEGLILSTALPITLHGNTTRAGNGVIRSTCTACPTEARPSACLLTSPPRPMRLVSIACFSHVCKPATDMPTSHTSASKSWKDTLLHTRKFCSSAASSRQTQSVFPYRACADTILFWRFA